MSKPSTHSERPRPRRGGPMGGPGVIEKPKNFKKSMAGLLRYLKPYFAAVIVALLFAVSSAVISVLAPTYLQEIADAITTPFMSMPPTGAAGIDLSIITRLGITLAIMYGCNFLFSFVQSFIMSKVNQSVCFKLREELSSKVNKVPLSYFDRNSYGDVLSRITNDIDTIGQTLNQSIVTLVSSFTLLVGVLIAMLTKSWQMGLTALATVPISFALIMIIVKASQKHFVTFHGMLGKLNGHIEEMYSGAAVVAAFNGEERSIAAYDEMSAVMKRSAHMSQFLSGLMMPVLGFVASFGIAAVCAVGSVLILEHGYGVGVIAAFLIFVRIFQNSINQLSQVSNTLQSTAAAGERVFAFLSEPEQEDESEKSSALQNVRGAVEFNNVVFGYDKANPVIKGFSASVKAGQKVAIVGPTGAGKTTIVNLLMRFYELDSGSITVDGVDISSMKREDARALFGMVLQDTWLFEGTIRENVVFNMKDVPEEEIVAACKTANIDHFIRTQPEGYGMKLDDDAAISNGQKQLLTIARAMIQNSPMLILDEATSSVDTRTEQMIQDAMDKLTKGRTSFVIAHRLSTIKNADLILVLKDGDIIEKGTHDQLLSQNAFYATLYKSQFTL